MPVITRAPFARSTSRQDDPPAVEVVAALRVQPGGCAVTSAAGPVGTGADGPGAGLEREAPGAPVHR